MSFGTPRAPTSDNISVARQDGTIVSLTTRLTELGQGDGGTVELPNAGTAKFLVPATAAGTVSTSYDHPIGVPAGTPLFVINGGDEVVVAPSDDASIWMLVDTSEKYDINRDDTTGVFVVRARDLFSDLVITDINAVFAERFGFYPAFYSPRLSEEDIPTDTTTEAVKHGEGLLSDELTRLKHVGDQLSPFLNYLPYTSMAPLVLRPADLSTTLASLGAVDGDWLSIGFRRIDQAQGDYEASRRYDYVAGATISDFGAAISGSVTDEIGFNLEPADGIGRLGVRLVSDRQRTAGDQLDVSGPLAAKLFATLASDAYPSIVSIYDVNGHSQLQLIVELDLLRQEIADLRALVS